MRLPGRLSAAIEVLTDIEAHKRPVSEALKAWGIAHRFAGAGDRAAIGNLVYDALRRRASHAYAMGEDSPRALVLSTAVRDWGEQAEALSASFAGDAHAPAAINAAELARLTAAQPYIGAPDWVLADIPQWCVPEFSTLGPDWVAEGVAMTGRPALDLRVNTLKADRARALKSLSRFGAEPTEIAPHGLRIAAGGREARTANVAADEAYLKGLVEIQDQGSQIVSALIGARPGEQVLDFCAGGGGKTMAMAAEMDNRGQIFAHDADRVRLAPIYDRLKRNGVRNVQVRPPGEGALDDLIGRMDRVVVDAPCTGTGTWRRRPDTKWKLSEAQLLARCEEQQRILGEACRFVRPGGVLAYITCSVLEAENGGSIGAFLAAHRDFTLLDAAALWRETFPAEAPEQGRTLTLTPLRTGTDGFFFAALRRG